MRSLVNIMVQVFPRLSHGTNAFTFDSTLIKTMSELLAQVVQIPVVKLMKFDIVALNAC